MYDLFVARYTSQRIHPFFNKKVWKTNPRTEGKGPGGWVDVIHIHPG